MHQISSMLIVKTYIDTSRHTKIYLRFFAAWDLSDLAESFLSKRTQAQCVWMVRTQTIRGREKEGKPFRSILFSAVVLRRKISRSTNWKGSTALQRKWSKVEFIAEKRNPACRRPIPLHLVPPGRWEKSRSTQHPSFVVRTRVHFFCFPWGSPEPQSFGPNFALFREALAILWL